MGETEARAREVCGVLRQNGYRALFAGGCVRDRLLGTPPKDFDIATDALPQDVEGLFSKTIPVGAAFGVIIVVEGTDHFEVATFRKDGPYIDGRRPSSIDFVDEIEDARRRDFTVNALFYDPEKETVLDYVGGQSDLEAGLLRCVGDPPTRFSEDYLRLLRAVRFSARLDFDLAPETHDAITACAPHILRTSPERIRDELVKMLTGGRAHRSLELLDKTGLLEHILPEVHAMKGVEQPEAFHPEGDVFVHTMLLMKHLESRCTPTLALGALLHDVGKPDTQTFEDRIRFNQHDKVGAEIARKMCRRLRFSNEDCGRITWLVAQHMRLAAIPQMKESKRKRFVREEGFSELIELCRLDCLASHGGLDTIEWIETYLADVPEDAMRPTPLITGRDLIEMGLTPGPEFKRLLQAVEDAQLEGTIGTKTDAKSLVKDFVSKGNTPTSPGTLPS
jgi:poly(A) polymerase